MGGPPEDQLLVLSPMHHKSTSQPKKLINLCGDNVVGGDDDDGGGGENMATVSDQCKASRLWLPPPYLIETLYGSPETDHLLPRYGTEGRVKKSKGHGF